LISKPLSDFAFPEPFIKEKVKIIVFNENIIRTKKINGQSLQKHIGRVVQITLFVKVLEM
jgi:hypothetical protein